MGKRVRRAINGGGKNNRSSENTRETADVCLPKDVLVRVITGDVSGFGVKVMNDSG